MSFTSVRVHSTHASEDRVALRPLGRADPERSRWKTRLACQATPGNGEETYGDVLAQDTRQRSMVMHGILARGPLLVDIFPWTSSCGSGL